MLSIHVAEHIPFLAKQTERLAIIRSICHTCVAHAKAMYWNMSARAAPAASCRQPAAVVLRLAIAGRNGIEIPPGVDRCPHGDAAALSVG